MSLLILYVAGMFLSYGRWLAIFNSEYKSGVYYNQPGITDMNRDIFVLTFMSGIGFMLGCFYYEPNQKFLQYNWED